MALEGKLSIGNKSYDILECEYELFQSIDQTGKPAARPRGGLIHLIMKSTGDDDMLFQEWMIRKSETKSGKLEFVISEGQKRTMKTISFSEAFCVKFYEYFNYNNSILMYMKVSISAEEIIFGTTGNTKFTNEWNLE